MSENPPLSDNNPNSLSRSQTTRLFASPALQLLIPAFLPLSCLIFFVGAPHSIIACILWTLPVAVVVLCDYFSPSTTHVPSTAALAQPHMLHYLYALAVLHGVNILLMLITTSQLPFATPDDWITSGATLIATRILLGTTACCSAICVAHELLHTPNRLARWLARALLWTVLYDHFAIEHIWGHHKSACTANDPATARLGESFRAYWRRSVPAQFKNAWRLENRRLHKFQAAAHRILRSNAELSATSRHIVSLRSHRVLQGLITEAIIVLVIATTFGWLATALFLYQAYVGVRLLEAVNYFQHWGLQRSGKRLGSKDAWTTDSWFTEQIFLGLSNHAYHHQFPIKPWYRLKRYSDSPMLPHGYFVMMFQIRFNNPQFQIWATDYLKQSLIP